MKRIILLLISISSMVGCAPATPVTTSIESTTPSLTPKPIFTNILLEPPVLTSTPAFTPVPPLLTSTLQIQLATHDWKPAPILITYNQDWFGFCDSVCPPDSSPFVLYGDGTLIIQGPYNPDNGQWHYRYKKLNQNGICRILNTIDQTGYFDFDPSTYTIPEVNDAGNWQVEIHAWRNKNVSLYGLGDEIDFLNQEPSLNPSETISPASIREAFTLLYNFPLDELEPYVPDLLGVWVWKSTVELSHSKVWTLDNISLAKLFMKVGSPVNTLPRPIYLNGSDAKKIYAMFNNSNYYGEVTQNGISYGIYVRPILPLEQISGDKSVLAPAGNQIKIPSSMHCSPSDGTMPIPPYAPK